MMSMLRSLILVSFLFLAVVSSSAGQPSSDPDGRCRALFSHLVVPILAVKEPSFGNVTAEGSDGCLFANVTAQMGPTFLSIDAVNVDHAVLSPENLPMPEALRMSVTGINFGVRNNPVYNYIMKSTNTAPSLLVDYSYDEKTKALNLTSFSLEWGRGTLNASGAVLGFAPTRSDALPGIAAFMLSLKSFKLALSDPDSSIQRPVMMSVGLHLLEGSADPAAKDAELRKQAAAWLGANLPRFNISSDSISATIAAMQAFPKAGKPLDIEINPPKPIGLPDLATVVSGAKAGRDILPDGAVKVTYGN